MKNLLNHFYHVYPDKVFKVKNVYYFYIDDIKYYFVEFNRNIEEINTLVELTNTLFNKNIKVHTFIKTIDDTFFVKYMNDIYVLLRVNCDETEEIDIYDIVKFNNLIAVDTDILFKNDWSVRWSTQVDKFEDQVLEYNNEYSIMIGCFDYYIGLAENAISYLKTVDMEDRVNYLSHKRIKMPLNYGMLYNPLNFMFDSKIRDIAEYIKLKFFNSEFDFDEMVKFIDEGAFDINDIKLLYARLLYPTYYFDFFEKVINDDANEERFNRVIELSSNYEEFLKEFYNWIKLKYPLQPVDWIVNLDKNVV